MHPREVTYFQDSHSFAAHSRQTPSRGGATSRGPNLKSRGKKVEFKVEDEKVSLSAFCANLHAFNALPKLIVYGLSVATLTPCNIHWICTNPNVL